MILGLFIIQPVLSHADWNNNNGNNNNWHGNNNGNNNNWHGNNNGWQGNNNGWHGNNGGWGGHDGGWWHSHSYVGVNFSAWPQDYYYGPGYYAPTDGVLVSPPITVVQQPVTIDQPTVVVNDQDQSADSFTINIPNSNGGYIAVVLKKSANGFIGPQGEFYSTFPTVAQLEVIYGKQTSLP